VSCAAHGRGSGNFQVAESLIAPDKPDTKSYADLVKVLTKHFQPTPSETVQRFKFHGRTHQPAESVAAYVAEFRAIAEHCNFGASLQGMLRDQIVCGINDKVVQRHLVSESFLSFDKALSCLEDLFATLSGGRVFSKVDLSQGYQQLPLDEESQKLAVINTHKGLFNYTRLPLGISSTSGILISNASW